MCLNTITKRFNPPDPKIRKAWKYVLHDHYGEVNSLYKYDSFVIGVWYDATGAGTITCTEGRGTGLAQVYAPGFHVFPTREEARKAKRLLISDGGGLFRNKDNIKLVKVEVSGVTVEGTDATSTSNAYLSGNVKTWIAQRMRIVQIVKD